MYAYIPSPFGGRLPSYALAKADKPEEPKTDKPEEPKAEEPAKVNEPKPEEPKTEEASASSNPLPEPAPAPEPPKPEASTENPPQASNAEAVDTTDDDQSTQADSPYNWSKINDDYNRLSVADKKMFNRYLKNRVENGTDPRQALQFLAKKLGIDVKGYLNNGENDTETSRFENKEKYNHMLWAADVGRDPSRDNIRPNGRLTSNKGPVPNYEDKNKAGTPAHIPLGHAKTKKVVDKETGEVKKVIVNANPVAQGQARRRRQDQAALGRPSLKESEEGEETTLQELIDSNGGKNVVHNEAKLHRPEAGTLTEIHQTGPKKEDVIITEEGQNAKAGTHLHGFVDPDDKDEVKTWYKPLEPIKSTDGSDLMVYVAPIRIGLNNVPVYFDKNGNRLGTAEHPLDENELAQLGPDFEAKHRKIIYGPFFGEREVAEYKEEPSAPQYHFTGGEMVGRKYKGKLKSLGNDISIGAVLDKDRKPVPLFFLGDYNVPLDLKNANLTREQRALIDKTLKDPPDFYQDANGNPRPKNAEEPAKEPKKKKKNEPDPLADADLYSVKRDGSVVQTTKNTSQWDREALDFGKDVEINGKKYRPVINTLTKHIIGYLPAEEKPDDDTDMAKSATMTIREMRMPSISDMIHDRRLRSAPYPSVTPLGRALP